MKQPLKPRTRVYENALRLDLWRVGIMPDPERLVTKQGREIAKNTDYDALIRWC